MPVIIFFKISNVTKFSIIFTSTVFLFANSYYGDIRIKKIEQADKKQISPAIKLVSPRFKIERFFIEEPIESKLIDLFEISYPLNKDYLLVFPEGITNMGELNRFENDFSKISDRLTNNTKIILGITLDDGEKIYNSLALFNKKFILEDYYNKNKLVPFGEFLPFEKFLSNFGLKKITQGYRSFSSSNLRKVINVNSISFLPLICYEIIFSGKLNVNKSDYDFILNISEDGWFGKSIGPVQHLSHSIFRSIEEGKHVIRSTNNGVSAFVNPKGQITKQISDKGYFDVNKIRRVDKTYFAKHGNKIFFYFVIIYIIFSVTLKIRENK